MRRSDVAVAGSEDQPGKSFEFRVPDFELGETQFQTLILAWRAKRIPVPT